MPAWERAGLRVLVRPVDDGRSAPGHSLHCMRKASGSAGHRDLFLPRGVVQCSIAGTGVQVCWKAEAVRVWQCRVRSAWGTASLPLEREGLGLLTQARQLGRADPYVGLRPDRSWASRPQSGCTEHRHRKAREGGRGCSSTHSGKCPPIQDHRQHSWACTRSSASWKAATHRPGAPSQGPRSARGPREPPRRAGPSPPCWRRARRLNGSCRRP
jgi:hypothetical protein